MNGYLSGAVAVSLALAVGVAVAAVEDRGVAPRNRRPYAGIDWAKCRQVTTTSHVHCRDQRALDVLLRHGFGLMTLSNYWPSAPTVPGKTFTKNHWRFHSDWPIRVNGVLTKGPFDWNKIIEPWKDEIDPAVRGEFPFDPAKDELMFPNWPEGMLEAPNAEHHGFMTDEGVAIWDVHMNGLGSTYTDGIFDARNRFKTMSHGYQGGSGEKWRTAVDRMIAGLVYPDGGGVTVNHPTWTNLDRELFLKMLDHDPRVLGCEALNAGTNDEPFWDWVLATGRQCFGFFVPDHRIDNRDFGANILVVSELTVHECLKAYRQGNFYGSLHALGELRFTGLAFDGKDVTASTDKPSRLQVVTAKGVVAETTDGRIRWTVPVGVWDKNGAAVHVFARVRAYATDGTEEVIWSQPFMLQERNATR